MTTRKRTDALLADAIRAVSIHEPALLAAGEHLLAAFDAKSLADRASHTEEAALAIDALLPVAKREAPGAYADLVLVRADLSRVREMIASAETARLVAAEAVAAV